MMHLVKLLTIASLFSYGMTADIMLCDGGFLAELVDISIVPSDPYPGESYTTHVNFWWPDSQKPVTDGKQYLKVTLSGFPLVDNGEPLCDNVPCPIVNGWNNYSWSGDVPSGVHGDVVVSEDWKTVNDDSIVCFSVRYYI